MTPDQMREQVLLVAKTHVPPEGQRTLWLATSDGNLHEHGKDPDHLLHGTPKIAEEDFRGSYVDQMLALHRAHLVAGTEREADVFLLDIVSANRRHPWRADCKDEKMEDLRPSREGVFSEEDVKRIQETIRRNAMLNEGIT